tara:strand:- start:552 stop:857 length:306 start_codon:yes stop_codon:yes gene_type:complete
MDKLQSQWNAVKDANPSLLDECYQLCLQARSKGIKRWSADAMFHVLRWESSYHTESDGIAVKINNNYSSLVARDLMDKHPDLEGFFSLRVRKPRYTEGQLH